jgi:hypothetical protein
VQARYPGADARVVHLIDPKVYFIRKPAAPAGLVEIKLPKRAAG